MMKLLLKRMNVSRPDGRRADDLGVKRCRGSLSRPGCEDAVYGKKRIGRSSGAA